ncbi:MAG: hypothetical protein ABI615_11300 [Chthoniobacterales bacterium]
MSPIRREQFRTLILLACLGAGEFGVVREALIVGLRAGGFRQDADDQLNDELAYLVDKNFLSLKAKAISPENRQWKITADGRDFLAEGGLA